MRHQPPETPRKVPRTDAFATPNAIDRIRGEPSTRAIRSSPTDTPESHYQTPLRGANTITPTPTRYRDVMGDMGNDSTLVDDVLQLLRSKRINVSDAEDSLKQVLNRHALRTQGIVKGREIARLGLKAKDAKLAELQLRVATLEAELETERATIEHLKWQIETGETPDC
jgi:hypothetical protein